MARKKTTKSALAAIHRFECALEHVEHILKTRAKYPEENWTEHTKKWTPEYINAYMRGFLGATECVLHDQGCWAGFYYIDSAGEHLKFDGHLMIESHPEYRDWRVKFLVRE